MSPLDIKSYKQGFVLRLGRFHLRSAVTLTPGRMRVRFAVTGTTLQVTPTGTMARSLNPHIGERGEVLASRQK